jgi:hypothetical protein
MRVVGRWCVVGAERDVLMDIKQSPLESDYLRLDMDFPHC